MVAWSEPARVCLLFIPSFCVILGCGSDRDGLQRDGGGDTPQLTWENTAQLCSDGRDNDDDGYTDCEDQDCRTLAFCLRRDASSALDGSVDSPRFDTGLKTCAVHWDCGQGDFCYHGRCLRDEDHPVYHCGKAGCPPGQWCITQQGTRARCSEDDSYACTDACDCGPAHCCVNNRCVRDLADPWLTGPVEGNSPEGKCQRGVDATYCCTAPACFAGLSSTARPSEFRCHDRTRNATAKACGGNPCYGTACHCAVGQSCIDTLLVAQGDAPPGIGFACNLLAGGSCVPNALAEAVYGIDAADLLPCCWDGCSPGEKCDAGALREGSQWAYRRVVGTCGSCGDPTGACEPWEPASCGDCSCGDGVCSAGEAGSTSPCEQDCGSCGDGSCGPGETELRKQSCVVELPGSDCFCGGDCVSTVCGDGICDRLNEGPSTCAEDCPCVDSGYFSRGNALCGDGVCQRDGCLGPESCQTCREDCGPCEWERVIDGTPYLTGNFRAAWGTGDDLFIVGRSGAIVHFNGLRWVRMPSKTTVDLNGVWGSDSSDVFVVGDEGTILHFDGTAWAPMPSGTTAELNAVWGMAGGPVHAVGGSSDASQVTHVVLELAPGSQGWTQQVAGSGFVLHGVGGSGPSNVLAVGTAGTILHHDGFTWAPIDSGTTEKLHDVHAVSATDVLVVGSAGTILHHDGSSWTSMPSNTWHTLHSVWTDGAAAFAVGATGTILHHDGVAWSTMPTGITTWLHGVWQTDAGTFAVGDLGTVLEHDSGSWSPAALGVGEGLNSLFVTGPNSLVVVGSQGSIVHYDGQAWTNRHEGDNQSLFGLWGSGSDDLFAVGGQGRILHYDGSAWTPMDSKTTTVLQSVWGSGPADVFAVGHEGTILHYDGSAWAQMDSKTTTVLQGVWGNGPTDVFTVGWQGTILHYDGASWEPMSSGTTLQLYGVWSSGPADAFAVGHGGTILHYDGASWTPMISPTTATLTDVWGSDADHVFAAAMDTMLRYSNGAWVEAGAALESRRLTAADYDCLSQLGGVHGLSAEQVFAVGIHNTVLRYVPPPAEPTSDGGTQPTDAGLADAARCGDGSCDLNESCDGRNATVSCEIDCPGGYPGHPQKEYCFVSGVCVGPGCA